MRLATVAQARELDALATTELLLSPEILMESAGALAARELILNYWLELKRGPTIVVCGPGHNGADGLVLARHLLSSGYDARVILVGEVKSALAKSQRERFILQGGRVVDEPGAPRIVVDALFGTGFRAPVEADWINKINRSRAVVVALDVPSGLDADTGQASPLCVRADLTLTFGCAKPGFYIADGPSAVGRVRPLAIGYSPALCRRIARSHILFGESLAAGNLPRRPRAAHKSTFGHALIAAGRVGMSGAGVLAAGSALRTGVGYVTWASFGLPENTAPVPEALTADLNDDVFWKTRLTAAGVGPGLGTGDDTARLIERLRGMDLPVVLDADALSVCAREKLWPLPKHWILTPHAGELARILGAEVGDLERDRFAALRAATALTGAVVVYKGHRTLVGEGSRAVVINAGNNALAKAGSGDVLTGLITGLLAQGVTPLKAAATGCYLHGRMADEWVRGGRDQASLNAGDLRDLLPSLMAGLRASVVRLG